MVEKNSKPFLLTVFNIQPVKNWGNRCVAEGIIQSGNLAKNERIQLVALDNVRAETSVLNVQIHQPASSDTQTRASVTLRDLPDSERFKYGWMIAPPDSMLCHASFLAEVTFLTPEQGGRQLSIVFVIGYAPTLDYHMILRVHDLTFLCAPRHPNPETLDYMEVKPGETVTLLFPVGRYIPVEAGTRFLLQEGAKVVAAGMVLEGQ